MAIEEIGTLCAISLLVFIRMNIRKEGVGIAIIYVLGGVIILPMLLKFAHMVVIIVQKYFRKHRVQDYEMKEDLHMTNQTSLNQPSTLMSESNLEMVDFENTKEEEEKENQRQNIEELGNSETKDIGKTDIQLYEDEEPRQI